MPVIVFYQQALGALMVVSGGSTAAVTVPAIIGACEVAVLAVGSLVFSGVTSMAMSGGPNYEGPSLPETEPIDNTLPEIEGRMDTNHLKGVEELLIQLKQMVKI